MKAFLASACLLIFPLSSVISQVIPPLVDSNTVGYWRFNENTGPTAFDLSSYHNDGIEVGTAIVPGKFGEALAFDGSSYVQIPYPLNGSLDFGADQSFTVEAWFNTVSWALGQTIVRKGLAPVPGYALNVDSGRVGVIIGNRSDGSPPDTLLIMWSDQRYNDGQWHYAALIRDRELQKLFLYVDGAIATTPIDDHFPYPLVSSVALDIGNWAVLWFPAYFNGVIDEVRITRGARHQQAAGMPEISAIPPVVNFGVVPVGQQSSLTITIANFGWRDTLRIGGFSSTNPRFSSLTSSQIIPAGGSSTISVAYAPIAASADTGSLNFVSNDSGHAVLSMALRGEGFLPGAAPVIRFIKDIPNDEGKQVRVDWYRSVHDGLSDSLPAVQYGVWRRVDGTLTSSGKQAAFAGRPASTSGHRYAILDDALWDFIAALPAVKLGQYALVAPTLFDSAGDGIHWSVFRVSVQLSNDSVAFSDPDSGYSVRNIDPALSVNDQAIIPDRYSLEQNYPNPFNPSTVIRFSVAGSKEYGVGSKEVKLVVCDILGREVATLVNERKAPGSYEVRFDASGLASGVYFYKIEIHPVGSASERDSGNGRGDFVATRKLVLVR